jgi:hypothetical protein
MRVKNNEQYFQRRLRTSTYRMISAALVNSDLNATDTPFCAFTSTMFVFGMSCGVPDDRDAR